MFSSKLRLSSGAATILLLVAGTARSQTPVQNPAAAAPAQPGCSVQHLYSSNDNLALWQHHYDKAEELFKAILADHPNSDVAKVGLVRSLVGEGKLAEAQTLAAKYDADKPNDAMLQDAMGEAYFAHGQIAEAAETFNKAMHTDPCLGRVHYDVARFQRLSGNFLSAQKQIDLAHKLSPDDVEISVLYGRAHAHRRSPEETVARLTQQRDAEGLDAEKKASLDNIIKRVKAEGSGDCESAEPIATARLPLYPITHGDGNVTAISLELTLNGKRDRLEVDTGASGFLITRAAANAAGLTSEAEIHVGGIGDEGARHGSVAHVASIRVGNMEFHNCVVEVVDRISFGTDGLIGPDVFSRWLVTLDVPMRELRLDPMPLRPDETTAASARLETSGSTGTGEDDAEAGPHDRYIAPSMQNWTRVYRDSHFLIVPTRVNDLPPRLFMMDSGAFSGDLLPSFAHLLGNVVPVDTEVRGLSGVTQNVFTVDKQITLDFGGVRQPVRGITVIDLGALHTQGVEVSGIIGFTALREVAVSIDYRDNLIRIVYDPKHGVHAHGDLTF